MSTQDKVIEIMKETLKFDKQDLTAETNLFKDLGVDSLDAVELVMALEEEYGIEIPDEDVPNLTTIGSIANYIDEHCAAEA